MGYARTHGRTDRRTDARKKTMFLVNGLKNPVLRAEHHDFGDRVHSDLNSVSRATKKEPRGARGHLENEIQYLLNARQLPWLKIHPRQDDISS